jgi:4-hydroxy-3-polyprenylbenzoate decarboxylase
MYRDLGSFVSALERSGELVRVSRRVSAVLEIADLADRVSKTAAPRAGSASSRANDPAFCGLGGPAVLFEDVEGRTSRC